MLIKSNKLIPSIITIALILTQFCITPADAGHNLRPMGGESAPASGLEQNLQTSAAASANATGINIIQLRRQLKTAQDKLTSFRNYFIATWEEIEAQHAELGRLLQKLLDSRLGSAEHATAYKKFKEMHDSAHGRLDQYDNILNNELPKLENAAEEAQQALDNATQQADAIAAKKKVALINNSAISLSLIRTWLTEIGFADTNIEMHRLDELQNLIAHNYLIIQLTFQDTRYSYIIITGTSNITVSAMPNLDVKQRFQDAIRTSL